MNHPIAIRLADETVPANRRGRGFFSEWAGQATWILLAILVFAPTIYWLWQRWTMSVWHNVHGLFIPFICAYFIYEVLRSDQVADVEQSAWGFLFLIAGLAMIALDSAIRTQLLAAFGMLVCLPGLSLLLLGKRRTQALAFVWVLSFFMLPIPAAFIDRFTLLLRRISAAGAEQVIALLGMPIARQDTMLFLPKASLSIWDACSGFSTLYACVALALVLAYMNPSWPRRALTLAAAFPVAIAGNILRCALFALIVERWGIGTLHTPLHPASGVVTFTAAAVLLILLSGAQIRGPAT